MDCCEKLTSDFCGEPELIGGDKQISRRTVLKQLAGLASGILFVSERNAYGQGRQLLLAFCGQLLCVVPYEVTRARGHFAEEGLDVRLVYTRGGNVAMQALVGGAVDYAGNSRLEDCRSLPSQAGRKPQRRYGTLRISRTAPSGSRVWATPITS